MAGTKRSKIKKNDQVAVIAGRDSGEIGDAAFHRLEAKIDRIELLRANGDPWSDRKVAISRGLTAWRESS